MIDATRVSVNATRIGVGPGSQYLPAVVGGDGHVPCVLPVQLDDGGEHGRDLAGRNIRDATPVARDRRLPRGAHGGVPEHAARGVLDVAEQRAFAAAAGHQLARQLQHVDERHAARVVQVHHRAWLATKPERDFSANAGERLIGNRHVREEDIDVA